MKLTTLAASVALVALCSCHGNDEPSGDAATDSSVDDDGASTDTADDDDGDSGDSGDSWTEPDTCICPTGLNDCGGYCLDFLSNSKNCGGCGNACGTDQACIDGDCVALCEEMAFSTPVELAALLADLSWVSTTGVMRYAVAGAEVSISSSELGEGYMFLSALGGVGLSSEILYGFDGSLGATWDCHFWDRPMYPSTAYGDMTVPAGLSFVADLQSYDVAAPEVSCSSEYFCFLSGDISMPSPNSCCCTVDPLLWNILTLSAAPAVCTEGTAPCDTDFASTNHSLCRPDYEGYIAMALDVHADCVEHEQGCSFDGRPCTCNVMSDDVWIVLEGTCNDAGRCDAGLAGHSSYHRWDQGCY